jgi:hypothetical protein
MNRSERFYRIDQLLTARKVVTRQELLDELEISWATLKRDLAFLKDRFNAPIIHDRDAGGYRFAEPGVGPSYELPGLWFSADETYALLTMHRLLSDLEPRLLAPHVAPLLSRLESILGQEGQRFDEIAQRIHLVTVRFEGGRPVAIEKVVLSTQHAESIGTDTLRAEVLRHIIDPVVPSELRSAGFEALINPTGRFTVGSPRATRDSLGARSSSTPTAAGRTRSWRTWRASASGSRLGGSSSRWGSSGRSTRRR